MKLGSVYALGRIAAIAIVMTSIAACGGSSSKKFTIGGTVSGKSNSSPVVLSLNGSSTVSVTSNGAFTFSTKLKKNNAYTVTVQTQPAGQTCVVANGTGTATANVTNVTVTCTNNTPRTIGGNVSGLSGTVVLQNNGGDNLSLSANGPFTFATAIPDASTYSVTVLTQPVNQVCTVTSGSGTATANVTNVAVNCVSTYTIGGSISGLTGTVVLQNNGGDDLSRNANGPFTFATRVPNGGAYAVTVKTQPAGQNCTVTSGGGNVASANVTSVVVTCADLPKRSIGGTVTGSTGPVVLQNNGGDDLNVAAAGPFTFATTITSGTTYAVTVKTPPTGQTCTVTNGSGTANADVTNVGVNCTAIGATYTIGGTITGPVAAGLKLGLAGSTDTVSPAAAATTFTFQNPHATNYEYWVGIVQQPTGQTCVLQHAHGVVASANVTNIAVICMNNTTSPLVGTYLVPIPGSLVYITLFADGVYIYGSVENNPACGTNDGNGVEYGVYSWTAGTNAFAIKSAVVDTNGRCGLWDATGAPGGPGGSRLTSATVTKTGTGQGTLLSLAGNLWVQGTSQPFQVNLTPVHSTASSIVGSFDVFGWHQSVGTFLNNATLNYLITDTQADAGLGALAGVEYACYSATGVPPNGGTLTPNLTATCLTPDTPSQNGPVDTNGTSGLSSSGGPLPYAIVDADTIQFGPAPPDGTTVIRINPN